MTTSLPHSLPILATLKRQLDLIQQQIDAEVVHNRACGVSWAAIADELGTSKQAAQQKYSRRLVVPAAESELICPQCGGSSGTNSQHYSLNHIGGPGARCTTLQLRESHAAYQASTEKGLAS